MAASDDAVPGDRTPETPDGGAPGDRTPGDRTPSDPDRTPMATTAPARAWLRPILMLLGGLLLAGLLMLADQRLAALLAALFALFMAYWTSPLRSGPHTSLADALARKDEGATVILWAPGNPLSARLQAVVRTPREDQEVVWVNVFHDAEARALVEQHGGADALPLVLIGEDVMTAVTAAELERRQEEQRRQDEERRRGGSPSAD